MGNGHIVLTHDVEVIEMKDVGVGTSWDVSTKPAEEPASWFEGFQRAKRRRDKTYDHGYCPNPKPVAELGQYDIAAANAKTVTTPLARELKGRHLQMIAFGGSIGTGLFVASGAALFKSGPVGLLLAYLAVGILQYCTMQSLCELSVMFPVAGSFTAFSTRFIDPSWGFALGWIYFLQWLFVLPLEIIAAVLTITYWNDSIPKAVFVTIFLVLILGINLSNIRIYGEAEFIFSIIKVIAVVGFILLGIVIHIGGPPHSGYIGGQYWSHPGPFNNGFKGFSSALMTAVFSYGGTEIVGLAAAETRSPLKSIPNAIKHIFWRIAIFYLVTILLIGLLVPSNNSSLINGKSSADASASAFVIAIESAGTTILPSVMNSIILIAVLSVGNSAIYASSRTLAAMAELSHAPRVFTYVDKKGRPLLSLLIAGCFGLLAYLVDLEAHDTIFQWLLSISAFGILFAWTSICFCHIRLRMAWIHASRPIDRLPFRSAVGIIGSWLTIAGYVMVMALHMWVSISPLQASGEEMSLSDRVQYFFLRTMALPIVAVLFIYHRIRFGTHFISVAEMDLDTGRRSYRFDLDREQDADVRRTWPIWKKVFNYLC